MITSASITIITLLCLDHEIIGATRPPELDARPVPQCVISEDTGSDFKRMFCSPLGQDGRTLGRYLQETQAFLSTKATTYCGPAYCDFPPSTRGEGPAASFAPRVKQLHLIIADNLTITDDCLANFTNMEIFKTFRYVSVNRNPVVTISPNAFRRNSKLTRLILLEDFYLPKQTILALESLKDRVTHFTMEMCLPSEHIIKVVSKFTNLISLVLKMPPSTTCPSSLFQASAKSLKKISLTKCDMPLLRTAMLQNLKNVTDLDLFNDGIENVEPGAFDDLVELRNLDMSGNSIERLPNGVFARNRKLESVNFEGNSPENLSRGNFTHCENFMRLVLDAE